MTNPFWSQRAQGEALLRQNRPVDLPVPDGDDGELEEEGQQVNADQLQGTPTPQALEEKAAFESSGKKEKERFSTPASWGELGQTAVKKGGPEMGLRTEGEMPQENSEVNEEMMDDHLQRLLEREVVEKLHQENLYLKEQVDKLLIESRAGTSWSEVSSRDKVSSGGMSRRSRSPLPRPPMSGDVQYTPQGTRIPTGPPPRTPTCSPQPPPRLPAWPFGKEDYERHDDQGPCLRRWGSEIAPVRDLHHGRQGGGTRSRQGLWDGGTSSRHGLCGRGTGSRQELYHEDGGELTPAQARMKWLEREVAALKEAMSTQSNGGHGVSSRYWEPFQRSQQGSSENARRTLLEEGQRLARRDSSRMTSMPMALSLVN